MATYKGNSKIDGIYHGNIKIDQAYKGESLVFTSENIPEQWKYIEIEINSSSGSYIVPLSAYAASGIAYSLKLFINDEYFGSFTGESQLSSGTGIEISGLTGDTAKIRIEPTDSVHVGWGKPFGYHTNEAGCNAPENKAKLIRVLNDPDYAHLVSDTSTGDFFRYNQFRNCISLIATSYEDMPDSVENIGNYFRTNQYYGTALINAPAEHLSENILSIGIYFRSDQYRSCDNLTYPAVENFPDNIGSIGSYFRANQYSNCHSLFVGDHIHLGFNTLLNANEFNYRYFFFTTETTEQNDDVPKYKSADSGDILPITTLTPLARKNYLTNRVGITGYEELDENWK